MICFMEGTIHWMRRLFGLVSAVAGSGFELLDGVVQSFLMG